MLATLVKLALPGRRPGLRGVTLRSMRGERNLIWKQDAERVRASKKGFSAVRRVGRLLDGRLSAQERLNFEEIEFASAVQIPQKHADRAFPTYFKMGGGAIRIAVSIPLARRRHKIVRATSTIPFRHLAPRPAVSSR